MSTIPKAAIEAAIKAYVDAPASASSAETMEAAILAAIAKMGEPVAWRWRFLEDAPWKYSTGAGKPDPGITEAAANRAVFAPLFLAPPVDPVKEQMAAALRRADQFIRNGIALGFIRMPDASTPDSAHQTPGIVASALDAYEAEKASK